MRAFFVAALLWLCLDQASKLYVLALLELEKLRFLEVFPPYLNLWMAWNQGVNFGLFADDSQLLRWALILISFAAAIGLFIWNRYRRRAWIMRVLTGLIAGGAIGNGIDRVVYGAVVDFLNMSCCGIRNPYAFNLADVGIVCGAVGAVLLSERVEKSSAEGRQSRGRGRR